MHWWTSKGKSGSNAKGEGQFLAPFFWGFPERILLSRRLGRKRQESLDPSACLEGETLKVSQGNRLEESKACVLLNKLKEPFDFSLRVRKDEDDVFREESQPDFLLAILVLMGPCSSFGEYPQSMSRAPRGVI